MSRRESRVSMNSRQNDALFEFENFKKKFLLVNKQVTKLNSTLSQRIEELNAQISILYTENLRLRESEIVLAAQLKREREKSRNIIAEAEAAAKRLSFLRQAYDIPDEPSPNPTPLRATQRPSPSSTASNSPVYPRLSRAPTIPQIFEDDEPSDATEDEDEQLRKSPSPKRKTKTKRLSASRLPLPSRVSSPPPLPPQIDFAAVSSAVSSKRKPIRRQSGLLVRHGSPVLASHVGEEEEEEEIPAIGEQDVEEQPVVKKEKRRIPKDKGKEKELEVSVRKRLRDEMGVDGKKMKLTDVTNSPRSRASQPADPVVSEVELEVARPSQAQRREFLSSSPPRSTSNNSSPSNYLPTPQNSSSPPPVLSPTPPLPDPDPDPVPAGRERRVRKSVNYAEPKLNTKMRKPDSEHSGNDIRKRNSAAAIMSTRSDGHASGHDADADGNDGETDGARSSLEGPQPRTRPSPDPALLPLPVSRAGSSASSSASIASSATPSVTSRRSKSRPHSYAGMDELDSESDDADTEYVPSSSGKGGQSWVNMGDRKKAGRRNITSTKHDDETARRHSMAV